MTLGRGARRLYMATSPASWRSANIFALTLDAAAFGGVLPTVAWTQACSARPPQALAFHTH